MDPAAWLCELDSVTGLDEFVARRLSGWPPKSSEWDDRRWKPRPAKPPPRWHLEPAPDPDAKPDHAVATRKLSETTWPLLRPVWVATHLWRNHGRPAARPARGVPLKEINVADRLRFAEALTAADLARLGPAAGAADPNAVRTAVSGGPELDDHPFDFLLFHVDDEALLSLPDIRRAHRACGSPGPLTALNAVYDAFVARGTPERAQAHVDVLRGVPLSRLEAPGRRSLEPAPGGVFGAVIAHLGYDEVPIQSLRALARALGCTPTGTSKHGVVEAMIKEYQGGEATPEQLTRAIDGVINDDVGIDDEFLRRRFGPTAIRAAWAPELAATDWGSVVRQLPLLPKAAHCELLELWFEVTTCGVNRANFWQASYELWGATDRRPYPPSYPETLSAEASRA